MSTNVQVTCFLTEIFKDWRKSTGQPKNLVALAHIFLLLSVKLFQRKMIYYKEKRTLSWSFASVSRLGYVSDKGPRYGSGTLARFPFDNRHHLANQSFQMEFSYLLGSTNSCTTNVHMKPFSTSVFKVRIWIFATTTKICTKDCSTQAHAKSFYTIFTPSYSLR